MGILDSETLDLDSDSGGGEARASCCVGDTLSGRYRLDEEIGRGGMGIVFSAWDSDLERRVAVKVIAADPGDEEARARLVREARAAAALNHPNIVAVHDVGEHEGLPYFVMELVEGPSLRQHRLQRVDEIIGFGLQVCSGLDHAHRHGLVHRDLKPGNILFTDPTAVNAVKIVDLGLAVRERGIDITREGGITGTVLYMSPEQALCKKVDGRADLYALGVILYELLTGRLPFSGDNVLAVLSQHLHAPVVPPRTYREDLPGSLNQAILTLLAKDPDQRFATALEAAEAIALGPDAALAEPVGALPALGGLVRGRMVGREAEIDSLRQAWSRAASGRGGMVLVSGEPGSGKTRLARELADYAGITGGRVLQGGCYELEAATPYLPFVEAIRSWVHSSSDDELRAAVGDAGAELARLAPELESRIGPFPEGPELSAAERRLLLFDGVGRFLFALAEDGGLLLVVDDLQWADQASLSLLHSLIRVIGSERVLVLGCYRETELDRAHPLAEALDNWNRERAAVRIHLKRLDSEATAGLLSVLLGDECLSDEFCASIHRETEGNPFFVEEVVKTLVEEEQIVCEGGEWRRREETGRLVLPQGVKAAIGRRLDRVSVPTTDVLRTAAILGKTFEYPELAAVAEQSEDELLDALDEAVAAQLLETRAGETIVFTHDKIREVLYYELNPIRRRRLHTRVAEGLEGLRSGGGCVPVEDLAHHFMEGGSLGKGLGYAMQAAADATALFAYADALRLYERARECAEALGRTDEHPTIDAAMGDVFNLKGEPRSAAAAYQRALDSTEDLETANQLRCKIGESYVLVGDERALDFVNDARASLDPQTQPTEVARATMVEARFHHYHGQSGTAAKLLLQALEPAERAGDPTLLGWIYGYLAGAHQHLIGFEESDGWARKAIELGEAEDNPGVASIGHEFLMENAFMCGRWRRCLEHADRHLALAEEAQSLDRLAWNTIGRAYANLGLGNLAEAEAAADTGIDLAERLGDERLATYLTGWRALAIAEGGRVDEAIRLADESIERGDSLGLKAGQLENRRVRACIAQLMGDHAAVIDLTAQIEELLVGTDESIQPAWMYPTRCQSLVVVGRLEEAEQRIGANLDKTRAAGMPHWEALTVVARGRLHTARGDLDAARADYQWAIEIFTDLGSRLELERALVLLSTAEE